MEVCAYLCTAQWSVSFSDRKGTGASISVYRWRPTNASRTIFWGRGNFIKSLTNFNTQKSI